jgi:predicted nucleic acid-binding protein
MKWPNVSGIDTNVLSYALDPAFPEHEKASPILKRLSPQSRIALNPTVFHETYHTLVYKQKLMREDANERLLSLLRQRDVVFLNQTKSISRNAIYLANKYELGGRDSLNLSNFLFNNIVQLYSHDRKLVSLGKITMKDKELNVTDPVI